MKAIRFGADPPPAPGVLAALAAAELVLIGPSNPYVSIDPILGRPVCAPRSSACRWSR